MKTIIEIYLCYIALMPEEKTGITYQNLINLYLADCECNQRIKIRLYSNFRDIYSDIHLRLPTLPAARLEAGNVVYLVRYVQLI